MSKLTKTFKSVNYTATCGDTYSRWSEAGKLHIKDAVELTVTDEAGKVVFYRVVRKGGMMSQTLTTCKAMLNTQYRLSQQ